MNHLFCPQSIVLFTVGAFHSLRNSANYVWGVNGTLIQFRAFYRKISGRSGTLNSYKGVPFSLWKFYLHCKWKRSVLALKLGPLRWVKYCDLTLLIRASTVQIPRADLDPRGREQPLMVLFWLKLWLNGCRKGWMRLWPETDLLYFQCTASFVEDSPVLGYSWRHLWRYL